MIEINDGHKVPIQSLIDHIKTAVDVDPWAKAWAETLLKKFQPQEMKKTGDVTWYYICPICHRAIDASDSFCRCCGQAVKRSEEFNQPHLFCTDGE